MTYQFFKQMASYFHAPLAQTNCFKKTGKQKVTKLFG
jgi:hypothetical protein